MKQFENRNIIEQGDDSHPVILKLEKIMLFTSKDLKKLIMPLIFEQLLAVTVGLADSLMVSKVGESAISAVSLVDSINLLLNQVFAALATGGAVDRKSVV